MEDWQKGTETTEREELDNMAWTEEHADWSADKAEKSKPGAEKSRLTAERMGCSGRFEAEVEAGM